MNKKEAEDLYIRSLDKTLEPDEAVSLKEASEQNLSWVWEFEQHDLIRRSLNAGDATFGPWFAAKVINKLQQAGSTIDSFLFGLFKKFQLAAIGIVVALLILNLVLSDDRSLTSVFGLQNETSPVADETIVPFDFSETLNNLK